MKKEENEWSSENLSNGCEVNINGEKYYIEDEFACLTYAILLLVDAINEKKVL